MARLKQLAKLLRSKNAGPFQLTIDIMFENLETYRHVVASQVISAQVIGKLLAMPAERVQLFYYEAAFSIKATVPRRTAVGDPEDNDLFGGQQFGPLVDLFVPDLPLALRGSES